jgi:hypothetical protein
VSQVAGNTDDLKHVLDAARAALDREFQRAERFDAKARGQATLAGSWFAVTQAVVGASLRIDTPRGWLIAISAAFVVQALALAILLAASRRVWALQERPDIGAETLDHMEESATAGDPEFGKKAIEFYRYVLYHAQKANQTRAEALDPGKDAEWRQKALAASIWWWTVLIVGFAEMAAALGSRIA